VSLESLTERIGERALRSPRLGYVVKVALTGGGVIRWDGTGNEPQVDTLDAPADTIIRISEENLENLLSGSMDPTLAYMTGKLRVEGSLGVAMKLAMLLGD
jgi:putative sterol carrier protein